MKRTATLVAGLLLVTGTVFASEWKLTGATVEGNFDVINTKTGALNSNGGDLNVIFKTEKDYGKAGTVGLELNINKNGDQGLFLNYSKTEGDFKVATKAKLINDAGTLLDGTGRAMEENGDTYIQWNVMGSDATTLTFYPWEVAGMKWDKDTFNSFDGSALNNNNGGIKLATKIADANVAVKFAATEGTTGAKSKYAVKGEFDTKMGDMKIEAAAGMATSSKTTFAAAKVELPVSTLTVVGEVNVEDTSTYNDPKVGFFVKGSYGMAELNGYKPTAYASFKSVAEDAKTETTIEAGLGLNKGSFTITPKVILNAADKAIYEQEGKADKSKSEAIARVTVKYGL